MFLLDTNVISELRKVRSGKADTNVAAWTETVGADALFISVITVQELEIGCLLVERRDKAQGSMLRGWIEGQVLRAFDRRILPVDLTVVRQSAKLHVPNPRPVSDTLIAATAVVHGMTIVTRNVGDFQGTGATILNPWLP